MITKWDKAFHNIKNKTNQTNQLSSPEEISCDKHN